MIVIVISDESLKEQLRWILHYNRHHWKSCCRTASLLLQWHKLSHLIPQHIIWWMKANFVKSRQCHGWQWFKYQVTKYEQSWITGWCVPLFHKYCLQNKAIWEKSEWCHNFSLFPQNQVCGRDFSEVTQNSNWSNRSQKPFGWRGWYVLRLKSGMLCNTIWIF